MTHHTSHQQEWNKEPAHNIFALIYGLFCLKQIFEICSEHGCKCHHFDSVCDITDTEEEEKGKKIMRFSGPFVPLVRFLFIAEPHQTGLS